MFHPKPMKKRDFSSKLVRAWQGLSALHVSRYRKDRQRTVKSAPCEVKIASRRRRADCEVVRLGFQRSYSAIRDGTGQGVTGLHGDADGL